MASYHWASLPSGMTTMAAFAGSAAMASSMIDRMWPEVTQSC